MSDTILHIRHFIVNSFRIASFPFYFRLSDLTFANNWSAFSKRQSAFPVCVLVSATDPAFQKRIISATSLV